ncbi:MAG TPA: terminase gpA endonuclease subunit [Xanthobacteraceae bacterium]|jgi:phage terminase large subunit GpA-like protein|nr:terminase gpA endonuclease subunit [Xanthobacteraceae bacterium]
MVAAPLNDPERIVWDILRGAFHPIPAILVSEWAEEHRYMSPETCPEPGRYQCDRLPYQREPMDAPLDEKVSETVLWWASQLGKTECLINTAGYFMHADPSPQLMIQPTDTLAEAYSKERIAPAIRDSKALRGLVKDPRTRDSGNTVLAKHYPGGSFVLVGANAPAGLAGRPRRVVMQDEIDRYPPSAGTEGDPCALADKRAENFRNAIKIKTSTGTVKGLSKIETLFEQSDKRKWHVCCPKCKYEFVLMWAHVQWNDEEPETAWIECPGRKCRLDDDDRVAMVRAGRWMATATFRGVRGYWLNGLNSLFGHQKGYASRIHQFVAEFLKAKDGGAQTLRVWINTFLAETYEEDAEKIDGNDILKRAEEYDPQSLPEQILVLTAGVDVHRLRIELEVKGWGVEEESWGIRKLVFEGDTEKDEVWALLDKALLETFTREDGLEMKIDRAFIDMGHKDKRVLGFCTPRLNRGVFPCRGVNRIGLNPPPLLPAKPSRNNKARIPHWNVGVTVAKTAIYDRLALPIPEARSMHFPKGEGYGVDYFKQLTAEKRKRKFQFGRPYFIFEKENNAVRNEALDLNVYALAALHSLAPIHWTKLEANLKKQAKAQEAAKAAQMVVEQMKSKEVVPNAGTDSRRNPDSETPQVPSDPAPAATSAEMTETGKIMPAEKSAEPAETKPAPAHHRRASGFRRAGGFVGKW